MIMSDRDRSEIKGKMKKRVKRPESDGSSSFQILLDFGRVLSVEALEILVEAHVLLVNVINVGVVVESSSAAELVSLVDLSAEVVHHSIDRFFRVLLQSVHDRVLGRVESVAQLLLVLLVLIKVRLDLLDQSVHTSNSTAEEVSDGDFHSTFSVRTESVDERSSPRNSKIHCPDCVCRAAFDPIARLRPLECPSTSFDRNRLLRPSPCPCPLISESSSLPIPASFHN
jgi:hypothetical protein